MSPVSGLNLRKGPGPAEVIPHTLEPEMELKLRKCAEVKGSLRGPPTHANFVSRRSRGPQKSLRRDAAAASSIVLDLPQYSHCKVSRLFMRILAGLLQHRMLRHSPLTHGASCTLHAFGDAASCAQPAGYALLP